METKGCCPIGCGSNTVIQVHPRCLTRDNRALFRMSQMECGPDHDHSPQSFGFQSLQSRWASSEYQARQVYHGAQTMPRVVYFRASYRSTCNCWKRSFTVCSARGAALSMESIPRPGHIFLCDQLLTCACCCAVQQPLTITSFALSLLLVFRTNSSYGRFAEARSTWGMVLNRSRDLARQSASFFPTATWDAKATFTRWTICFSKCLLIHLRPHLSLRDEVAKVLGREELQILLAAEHPVVMCIQVQHPAPPQHPCPHEL